MSVGFEPNSIIRIAQLATPRQAVDDYLKAANKRPGEFLFTSRRGPDRSMTTRQYARLVSEWIGSIGLDPRLFGTHSLRRTKATLIYRRTGNLRAVQLLLGHTKIESTVRYLGNSTIRFASSHSTPSNIGPRTFRRISLPKFRPGSTRLRREPPAQYAPAKSTFGVMSRLGRRGRQTGLPSLT
jgi:hypothetical protein